MKALRFDGKDLRLADIPAPRENGEALVRILRSGICNTDLEIVRGYAGFQGTIGHEFVGVVESCASDTGLVGRRVVGEINAGCRDCAMCRSGDSRHCPKRTVLGIVGRDGCHAEFITLPAENLLLVPEGIPDESAVFTEPLAAAYGITEQVNIQRETKVAVIGDGKLGILCAWSLALAVQHLFLVGKHQSKLRLAENDRVEGVLLSDAPKLGAGFDVVVEASGSESGFATALDLVKPRGKLILKSTFHGMPRLEASKVVVNEISVIGSRCGRFAPALEILEKQLVDVERLIAGEYPLVDGLQAIGRAAEPGVLKVLINMQGASSGT